MNCTHCNKPIILVPSAAERAAKDLSGRPASYYAGLFKEHSECALKARREGTSALIKSKALANAGKNPNYLFNWS